MDFSKLNNEFSQIQIKLENYDKEKNQVLKLIATSEKEILKLQSKIKIEKDLIMKKQLELFAVIKKSFVEELKKIFIPISKENEKSGK